MHPSLKTQYEKLAETIIENLSRRRMEGYYCSSAKDAVILARTFMNPGDTVSFGGSMTLEETGLLDELRSTPDIQLIDRSKGKNPEEIAQMYHDALSSDCYFMSTNAITVKGELVNMDGNGNRVAALIYGPRQVVILAGMNKVAADTETAISRVRNQAAPANCIRLSRKTPCTQSGHCHDCLSEECICSQLVITRRSSFPGRIKVILIGEAFGF